jgi:hypothetical protein
MKRSTLITILLAVILAHGLFFWYVADKKVLPPREHIDPPNFVMKEARFTDPKTGDKMHYEELTVSTKLSDTTAGR